MKNRLYWMLGVLCLLSAALFAVTRPRQALYTSVAVGVSDERRAEIDSLYKVSFTFDNTTRKAPVFLPVFEDVSFDEARGTAALFGFRESDLAYEDSGVWRFETGEAAISIGKRLFTVEYSETRESDENKENGETAPGGETGALEAAREFCSKHSIPAEGEAVAVKTDGGYEARFIGKLGPLPNYAFPTLIRVVGGKAAYASFARIDCERLNNFTVRPMKEAFYDLPGIDELDIVSGGREVDIKRVSLVYRLSESVLQPAYLFEGEYVNGGAFEYYVNALAYGE